MQGVTISLGSSVIMTSDFMNYKKLGAAYVAAKGYKHWPGVIENLKPIPAKEWKTKRPDKSQYSSKHTTNIITEGEADIIKQEWIVTDCEKQE